MLHTIQRWLRDLAPDRAPRLARRLPREMMHYWINPDDQRERALWMRSEFDRTGLRNRRIAGCTATDLPPLHLPAAHDASSLQLACLCSHFAAFEQALADGDDIFMVLEDDMMLPYAVDFRRLVEHAPANWEILQLYVVNAERVHAMYTRSYLRGRLWEHWKPKNHSTAAYLCSRDAAQAFLARFRPHGILDLRAYKGALVADELLYRAARTYTLTFPLHIENDTFDSTLNSIRRLHLKSHEAVRRIWSKGSTPDFATPRR